MVFFLLWDAGDKAISNWPLWPWDVTRGTTKTRLFLRTSPVLLEVSLLHSLPLSLGLTLLVTFSQVILRLDHVDNDVHNHGEAANIPEVLVSWRKATWRPPFPSSLRVRCSDQGPLVQHPALHLCVRCDPDASGHGKNTHVLWILLFLCIGSRLRGIWPCHHRDQWATVLQSFATVRTEGIIIESIKGGMWGGYKKAASLVVLVKMTAWASEGGLWPHP